MNATKATAVAALAGSLLLCGCGGQRGRTIGFTVMRLSNPFFGACQAGAEAVVRQHGDTLLVVDADGSTAKQMSAMEDLIQRRVACILLNPVNSDAASAAVRKANAAGIPVVTFDVDATKGDVECFVESNNVLAGELCADYVGWRLKRKGIEAGKVVIVDHPGVTSVRQRVDGFKKRLAEEYPRVKVVKTLVGQGALKPSMDVTENILGGDVKFDAIFGINDPTGLGATKALKAHKVKGVFVVAIDGAPQAIAELKGGGPFEMTVAQFPKEIARVAAQMAYKVIRGEPVAKHVKIPVMAITRDNLQAYHGWEGDLPAQVTIPWPSDLRITRESE